MDYQSTAISLGLFSILGVQSCTMANIVGSLDIMGLNVGYVTFWAQALRPYVSLESLTVGAHGVRPLFDNMNLSPQVGKSRNL